MTDDRFALRLVVGLSLTLLLVIAVAAYRGAVNPPEFPASVVAE